MEEWTDGETDRRMGEWTDGEKDGGMDRWRDGQKDGGMDRVKDRWITDWLDWWACECEGRWIHG